MRGVTSWRIALLEAGLWVVSILGAVSLGFLLIEAGANLVQAGPMVSEHSGPVHVVRPGESLSLIAREHEISVEALLSIGDNRSRFTNPHLIRTGQWVELP